MQNRVTMQDRETARVSAKKLMKNFNVTIDSWFKNENNIKDAFEMIERELGGYLSNPQSLYNRLANKVRSIHFKSGLVFRHHAGLGPGKDLLLVFDEISRNSPEIFKNLKHPEKGVYNILNDVNLTLALFHMRGDLLKELHRFELYDKKIILICEIMDKIKKKHLTIDPYNSFSINKMVTINQLQSIVNLSNEEDSLSIFQKWLNQETKCRSEKNIRFIREQGCLSIDAILNILKSNFEDEYNSSKSELYNRFKDIPSWKINILANNQALENLKKYPLKLTLNISEIMLSRCGALSFFLKNPYYSSPKHIEKPEIEIVETAKISPLS